MKLLQVVLWFLGPSAPRAFLSLSPVAETLCAHGCLLALSGPGAGFQVIEGSHRYQQQPRAVEFPVCHLYFTHGAKRSGRSWDLPKATQVARGQAGSGIRCLLAQGAQAAFINWRLPDSRGVLRLSCQDLLPSPLPPPPTPLPRQCQHRFVCICIST